jgi:hypothetical protein
MEELNRINGAAYSGCGNETPTATQQAPTSRAAQNSGGTRDPASTLSVTSAMAPAKSPASKTSKAVPVTPGGGTTQDGTAPLSSGNSGGGSGAAGPAPPAVASAAGIGSDLLHQLNPLAQIQDLMDQFVEDGANIGQLYEVMREKVEAGPDPGTLDALRQKNQLDSDMADPNSRMRVQIGQALQS